ncbi:protein kinase [Clostridium sp. SHJSY1]|uniref:protein kinase domain-containing protein n=1 Tax=Clostridium sp. SHJSY1 TaxID=2942483 RepID=UPI002875D5C6|nr:protein kinase [Clostridium sp. SHJSY1]MDS0525116.1 protein kinase [Clostridium sp. SHJSY1]
MIGTLLLNRYEILEKIGEGGMGTVYKGRCVILDTFVAIKIIKTELNNSQKFIDRFNREANLIASLSHPSIVKFYGVGSKGNINFLVMEYVDGKSLRKIINEHGRLDPTAALDIALQTARALEVAHKNNIIHRDVKPDNILITRNNKVKLMDFGLAKGNDSISMTSSNLIIGSAHYFSPEQANGHPVDGRTDLYALGIVMYEMVTGRVPFYGENTMAIIIKHANYPVTPPTDIVNNFPKYFNRVILKCLEKRPVERFQNATELCEALNIVKKSIKESYHAALNDTNIIRPNLNNKSPKDKYNETINAYQETKQKANIKDGKTNESWFKKNWKISLVFLAILIYIYYKNASY